MPHRFKKIIIVGPAFPLRGGIADFNEALCRALLKEDIEAEIVSFTLQYPSFLFPGKTQYDTHGGSPADLIISTKINSINPFNWLSVARYIKRQKPDGVIFRFWIPFMGPCLGTIARLIKYRSTIKVIAITDNIIPHEKRPGDWFFTRYFVNACDGFISMSKAVLQDLSLFTSNANKVFYPHPIYDTFGEKVSKEAAIKYLQLNPVDKHLLFFGFIRHYKGLDLLIQAMGDERIRKMNVKLIIAGEYYEDDKPYKEMMMKYNLQDAIILKTTFIPKAEVPHYFCAADMVVQPYRTATQSGITQIAYHFERPMLVTNVGGLPEIVPHNKVGYVTDVNPKSIADAIVDFYTNRREALFSKNTLSEKDRFSWNSFVNGVVDLFQKTDR